jgi:hypothetical protein
MSLKMCVRIAIGILASSGIAVILSGGALAANNGQDTASQKNSQNVWMQGGHGNGGEQLAPQSGDSNEQRQSLSNNASSESSSLSSSSQASYGGGNSLTDQDSGKGADQTANQNSNQVTGTNGTQVTNSVIGKQSQKTSSVSNSTLAGGGGSGQGQTVARASNNGASDGVSGVFAESTAGNSALVSEVAVVAPLVQPAGVGSNPRSLARTTILHIQPVITNRVATLAPDLAQSMPTAPAPSRSPVPAKSTGALAGLVVGLSNVVIPQPVVPTDAVSLKLILGVSLLTLVVLLANVFEFSYGQWLRRGGFATAARSDEPANSLTSPLFATPLLSGYVEQPPRLHSPILMVLVPNAYRKEDRR